MPSRGATLYLSADPGGNSSSGRPHKPSPARPVRNSSDLAGVGSDPGTDRCGRSAKSAGSRSRSAQPHARHLTMMPDHAELPR
jgi:hypothetical protein